MKVHGILAFSALAISLEAATLPDVQSMKITNTRQDWFYLEEVQVLNADGVDVASVAFGATTTLSEPPAFGSIEEGAIDDITDVCCGSGWHSSTSLGDQFLIINFPSPQTLEGQVTVWDRFDACCAQRLDGMLFEFFSEPEAGGDLIAAQQVDNLAADSLGEISTEVGASFELPDPDVDTDGDGLTDRYERAHELDPNDATGDNGAEGDPDKDGSTNVQEFMRETDPQVPDTDGDGLLDGVETKTGTWVSAEDTGTDPLESDSDGDGLTDGVETNSKTFVDEMDTGTDPNLEDSDRDGIRDDRELVLSTDPNDPNSRPNIAAAIRGVRSIRITNTLEDWFYIEEIDLFNTDDVDVASVDFGTTAMASEAPGFGGQATGPIDDIAANCCANGFHSSSDTGGQVLIFTFPTAQDLAEGDLRIWDRQDSNCCASRLDGMLFEFFDGPEATGELIVSQQIDNLAADNLETINTPEGAAVPLIVAAPTGPLVIQETVYAREAATMQVKWNSSPVEFFVIEKSVSLEPNQWSAVSEVFAAAPAPDESTSFLIEDLAESAAYFRVRRSPPPPFLAEDFEGEAPGWTVGAGDLPFPNQATRTWQLGTPAIGAHGGDRVYGVGFDDGYDAESNVTLTSPLVDLSGQRQATLRFFYSVEMGPDEGVRIEFHQGGDPAQAILLDPLEPGDDWREYIVDLTKVGADEISLAGKTFTVVFRFLTDGVQDNNGAGFYVDDLIIER